MALFAYELNFASHSRSFKVIEMTPMDRSYATLYWSTVVTIDLSCTIFELFDVEYQRDLEM